MEHTDSTGESLVLLPAPSTAPTPRRCRNASALPAHHTQSLTVPFWLHATQWLPRVGGLEQAAHLPRLLKNPRLHVAQACGCEGRSSTIKRLDSGNHFSRRSGLCNERRPSCNKRKGGNAAHVRRVEIRGSHHPSRLVLSKPHANRTFPVLLQVVQFARVHLAGWVTPRASACNGEERRRRHCYRQPAATPAAVGTGPSSYAAMC